MGTDVDPTAAIINFRCGVQFSVAGRSGPLVLRPKLGKGMSESPTVQGPMLFENWRAALQSIENLGGYECPLYSDARIVGQVNIGPYQFINTVAHAISSGGSEVAPVVVLRVDFHKEFDRPDMRATDTSNYHGGTLSDEIASVAALAMGCRLEAGPQSREFALGDARAASVRPL